MSDLVKSAQEAFEKYSDFYATGRLTQGSFHGTDDDGRQLACALGVLGENVESAKGCPAAVMPRWLAQMVPGFFDRQKPVDAFEWGKRFYAALARVDGKVPFSVVHDWHANTTTVLGIAAAEKMGRDTAPHIALQALHRRALRGDTISADEWRPVLRNSYAYADANADANANADAWKRLADGMCEALERLSA